MSKRMRTRTRTSESGPRAGVSVVEVLVALVVFTVGALAVVQQVITARQLVRAGEIITEAAAVAQYQMETLRSLPYDSLASASDTVWGFPLSWTVSGTTPKVVVLAVERPSVLGGVSIDSFVTYVDSVMGSP